MLFIESVCFFYGKNDIRFEEVDKPDISDKEILIQMKACGLCGTDIHKITEELVPAVLYLAMNMQGKLLQSEKKFRSSGRETGLQAVFMFRVSHVSSVQEGIIPYVQNSKRRIFIQAGLQNILSSRKNM